MAVPIESIQVGRVFEFKTSARRVVGVSPSLGNGFMVRWEYADGVKRNGKIGGSQWVHYFRSDAKRELTSNGSDLLLEEFKVSGQASYVVWLESQLLALRADKLGAVMPRISDEIMNIPCDDSRANDEWSDRRSAYYQGHRDACRAAADLVANSAQVQP